MKRVLAVIFATFILLTSCGKKDNEFLVSPDYKGIKFFGAEWPDVYEKEDYAVISMVNQFFLYDKKADKIKQAYNFNPDLAFTKGSRAEPGLDYKNDKVIIAGRKENMEDFTDHYYVYDVKKDKLFKQKGEIPHYWNDKEEESEYSLGLDPGYIMEDELEKCPPLNYPEGEDIFAEMNDKVMKKLFFKSRFTGKRIYPFKNNFNKKDFEIK